MLEEEDDFTFPVVNFTEFFTSLDDATLTKIAKDYPKSLEAMCVALTLDQQMLKEQYQKQKARSHN